MGVTSLSSTGSCKIQLGATCNCSHACVLIQGEITLQFFQMAQQTSAWRRYMQAFISGFFVAVPVTVTLLDKLAYVARVEGASMQPFLNPDVGAQCDVVLLNRWSVKNYHVQRGDIVSVVSPRNPKQKIIKRVIGLEGDFIRYQWGSCMAGPHTSSGHQIVGNISNHLYCQIENCCILKRTVNEKTWFLYKHCTSICFFQYVIF
ncbi:mitochondrial inner membrane protease subunit 2 isoform X3 [Fundulus heteroclitus]|uniref:mitochondrial inner membrane protease subunit 2 isoform X3 n=1 Tax=Fundulus heteroclitus TaxID=8078 RepID=UPI00165AB462|nr:mitochondrial inner membrane protease subunit 2 isoform X3 [Fundulus heteroclitus]